MHCSYVKEWLCCVACGGIIEIHEDGERFWIKKENIPLLTGPNTCYFLTSLDVIRYLAGKTEDIKKLFRRSGPLGRKHDSERKH